MVRRQIDILHLYCFRWASSTRCCPKQCKCRMSIKDTHLKQRHRLNQFQSTTSQARAVPLADVFSNCTNSTTSYPHHCPLHTNHPLTHKLPATPPPYDASRSIDSLLNQQIQSHPLSLLRNTSTCIRTTHLYRHTSSALTLRCYVLNSQVLHSIEPSRPPRRVPIRHIHRERQREAFHPVQVCVFSYINTINLCLSSKCFVGAVEQT